MSRHWLTRGVAAAMACCTATLNCTVVNSMEDTSSRTGATTRMKKATTASLGGPDRYLTSVSTDKPIYHGGEKVYVRGVLLNAANHKPLAAGQSANATVEIKGPKGDVVASGFPSADNSVWGCTWEIPPDEAGGEYSIRVSYPWDGHAPAERKFDIRAYRAPRLKSQITFLRDGYGPGEKVSATLDVKRAEGGAPEGAKVTVTARVDGTEIKGGASTVDANGFCHVSFELPHQIPRGEGTLALVIEDGGVVETASKTIPILLQTLDLQIFPEGGDLLAGYANRVYVQAKQPNGKPADLVAKLICKQSANAPVTEFRTEHEGRGRFEFTPVAGRDYYLAISQPAGIKTLYPLPKCKSDGAVVHADKDVFAKGEPIAVHVGCTEKDCRVTLAKHEVEVASLKINPSNKPESKAGILRPLSFNVAPDLDGVLTLTVWDDKGMPLAERLIFRQPANPLNISINADRQSYIPGEHANLTVKATDSHGKPVSAVVGVTVADDSVLAMVEKREQAPRLPVMVFLEPEVKDLADAQVYLDPKNAKAPLATDLLLGTQGWRRFALMDMTKFVEKNGDEARRAMAMKIQSAVDAAAFTSSGQGVVGMAAAGGMAGQGMAMKGMPMGGAKGQWFQAPMAMPMPAPMVANMAPRAKQMAPMAPPIDEAMALNVAAQAPPAMAMPVAQDALKAAAPIPALDMAMGKFNFPGSDFKMQNAIRAEFAKKRSAQILGREMEAPREPGGGMIVVREFAHQVRKNRKPTDRVDFSETLYWNAGVKTSAKTGEAKISFGLNDSVSTFRVFADGFAGDGAIGASSLVLSSIQPFYAEAKLPLEVTSGDRILLPVNLVNATGSKLSTVGLKVDLKGDFKLTEMSKSPGDIGAGNRVRLIQPINVGLVNGLKDFSLDARAGAYEDKVTRKLSVKPKGFPVETSFGGMLEPGKTVTHTIIIPPGVVPGSLVSNTAVYPTPLANLTEALQRMIQDPYGCFEQTSSTSYPLTMAQQYFLSHTGIDPKLIEQSRQKLDAGYKRLVGFWCPDKGYEWFGENPGHEALTAFGLLHFADMAQVREVD